MPTTYLKRVYFDALVYTHHQLEYLVEQYGADHILMGTDYPADMGEVDPIGMIEGTPGLDDVERRAILGRNAARLLNLEIPRSRARVIAQWRSCWLRPMPPSRQPGRRRATPSLQPRNWPNTKTGLTSIDRSVGAD